MPSSTTTPSLFRCASHAASALAGLLLLPATAAAATPIEASSNFPSFNNPDDEDRGFEAVEGDVFDHGDVLTTDGITINARITVLSVDGYIDVCGASNSGAPQTSS